MIEALRRGQRPERGYLGVGLQPLDENIADSLGLPKDRGELVRSVVPGEPAAKAGVQQGDVIIRVAGREVTPDETVSYIIANTTVGSRVPVEIIRDGRRQQLQVQVGQRPTEEELIKQAGGGDESEGQALGEETPVAPGSALGLSLQPLNAQIIRALNLPAGQKGVVITSVDPGSDAAEKGIRRGDVIVSVNRQAVTQPQQVIAAVDYHPPCRTEQRAASGQARPGHRGLLRRRYRAALNAVLLHAHSFGLGSRASKPKE